MIALGLMVLYRPMGTGIEVMLTVGVQLLAIYGALADARLSLRLSVCAGVSFLGGLLITYITRHGISLPPHMPFWRYAGIPAALLITTTGLLLPVRFYLGTIGRPRAAPPARGPSLLSLFWLTTYAACAALVCSLLPERRQVGIVFLAAFLALACFVAVLAALSESKRHEKRNFWCFVLLLFGSFAVGSFDPRAGWVYPLLVLGPLLGTATLRASGYRFRR